MAKTTYSDVLVIGDGIAGCAAAIAVQQEGAQVLVIDKAPAELPHGNTAFSGGSFRRASENYPAERFYQDIVSLSGNRADPELTRILVDGSTEARDWLSKQGVKWTNRSRDPDAADQSEGRGVGLAAAVRQAALRRGIKVSHDTEAFELIREQGEVTGVRARNKEGQEVRFHSGAVILATGGFQANPEMLVRYVGIGARNLVLRGSPFNTGDGIRMAEKVGAKLDWMDDFHGGLIHYGYKKYPEEGSVAGMRSVKRYEKAILVNREGKRFVDEGENTSDKTYAKFGKIVALTQPDGVAYAIFDAETRDVIEPDYTGPERGPIEATTIRQLAEKLGIKPDALEKTVADFNAGVRDGKCLSQNPPKTNFAFKIDNSPFYAYQVTGGFTFTFGGLLTTKKGEVLDIQSRPMPGLFAAGEITTGIFYGNYAGGSSLTRCVVFGRIAGQSAAQYVKSQS